MKAAIVSSKLLSTRPWAVSHWLGDQAVLRGDKVAAAERNLKAAETRLASARAEQEAEQKRVQGLIDAGLIHEIK